MTAKKALLEILTGSGTGAQFELAHRTIHIGRTQDNDIRLDDKLVSRHHAHITYEKGHYFLIDLDTPNGAFINKTRIRNQRLHNGDIIQLGQIQLRFLIQKSEDQKVAPYTPKGIPQQESISAVIKKAGIPPTRLILYGGGALLAGLALWIALLPEKIPQKAAQKQQRKIAAKDYEIEFKQMPALEKEAYIINKAKADLFYESGYREFVEKNYIRALDDFKTALELYPDHRLAQLYLEKTQETLTQEVDIHFMSAINYFNSGHYQLSIFHFRQVLALLAARRPPERYCAERDRVEHDTKNPDFEKYCDAQRKIGEARQHLLSR